MRFSVVLAHCNGYEGDFIVVNFTNKKKIDSSLFTFDRLSVTDD